jgi:hypothetical protein
MVEFRRNPPTGFVFFRTLPASMHSAIAPVLRRILFLMCILTVGVLPVGGCTVIPTPPPEAFELLKTLEESRRERNDVKRSLERAKTPHSISIFRESLHKLEVEIARLEGQLSVLRSQSQRTSASSPTTVVIQSPPQPPAPSVSISVPQPASTPSPPWPYYAPPPQAAGTPIYPNPYPRTPVIPSHTHQEGTSPGATTSTMVPPTATPTPPPEPGTSGGSATGTATSTTATAPPKKPTGPSKRTASLTPGQMPGTHSGGSATTSEKSVVTLNPHGTSPAPFDPNRHRKPLPGLLSLDDLWFDGTLRTRIRKYGPEAMNL